MNITPPPPPPPFKNLTLFRGAHATLIGALFTLPAALGHASISFEDGADHIFNNPGVVRTTSETVYVDNDPNNNNPTSLTINAGATLGYGVFDDKNEYVGISTFVLGTSSLTINGGTFTGRPNAKESSTVNITGGQFDVGAAAYDDATINIYGGNYGYGLGDNKSVFAEGNAIINIHGGTYAANIDSGVNAIINIFGGSFLDDIRSEERSRLHLHGGTIANEIKSYWESIIYIYGVDFKVNGQDVEYGSIDVATNELHTLTGTLSDGSALDNDFKLVRQSAGDQYYTGQIILVETPPIPEPASLALMGLGGLAMLYRSRSDGRRR